MAIIIEKLATGGNVVFSESGDSVSYHLIYQIVKNGDVVEMVDEQTKILVRNVDFNDVTSVISPIGGTVPITTAQELYDELVKNVFITA